MKYLPITIKPRITIARKDIWRAITHHVSEPPDGNKIRNSSSGKLSRVIQSFFLLFCLLPEEQHLTQRTRMAVLGGDSCVPSK